MFFTVKLASGSRCADHAFLEKKAARGRRDDRGVNQRAALDDQTAHVELTVRPRPKLLRRAKLLDALAEAPGRGMVGRLLIERNAAEASKRQPIARRGREPVPLLEKHDLEHGRRRVGERRPKNECIAYDEGKSVGEERRCTRESGARSSSQESGSSGKSTRNRRCGWTASRIASENSPVKTPNSAPTLCLGTSGNIHFLSSRPSPAHWSVRQRDGHELYRPLIGSICALSRRASDQDGVSGRPSA